MIEPKSEHQEEFEMTDRENGHEYGGATRALADELAKPLDERMISKRKDGIPFMSGQDTIRQLNRYYGMRWTSETIEIAPVLIGEKVEAYRAKVRLTVEVAGEWIVREGIGFCAVNRPGVGGLETAVKGAETDGLKRASVTFGAQFGLDLRDSNEDGEEKDDFKAPVWFTDKKGIHHYQRGRLAFAVKTVEGGKFELGCFADGKRRDIAGKSGPLVFANLGAAKTEAARQWRLLWPEYEN